MEKFLSSGNILDFAKGLNEFNDVVEETRNNLGLSDSRGDNIQVQLGLSPALILDKSTFIKWLRPKPLHLVFLRQHFDRVLTNANLAPQLKRFFSC